MVNDPAENARFVWGVEVRNLGFFDVSAPVGEKKLAELTVNSSVFVCPRFFDFQKSLYLRCFFSEVLAFAANWHVKTGFVRRLFLKGLRLHVSGRVDKQGFQAVRLCGNVGIYSVL